MEDKQKLLSLIEDSALVPEDKQLWQESIENYPPEAVSAFLEIFSGFPQEMDWFTANLKKKREAFAKLKENRAEGQRLLEAIFGEEKEKLAQLLSL